MGKMFTALAVVGASAGVVSAGVTLPPGFEIIHITDSPADNSRFARLNECGEVVYSATLGPSVCSEMFLYDNGALTRLTFDDELDWLPDINDEGVLVWSRTAEEEGCSQAASEIIVSAADSLIFLTANDVIDYSPRINTAGHLAWQWRNGQGCLGTGTDILYRDETGTTQVSQNGLHNSGVALNKDDEMVWVRTDFCADPQEQTIILHSAGETTELSPPGVLADQPTINDVGQVAWHEWYVPNGPDGAARIQLWDNGSVTTITEWGWNAKLNNNGDMYFIVWEEERDAWQARLYRGGIIYNLTDDPFWNTDGHINDWGEVAWRATPVSGGADIYHLRRIRNGEADFDGDVDLKDFAAFQNCFTARGEFDRLCDCRFLDIDHDRDVDLDDFVLFQIGVVGP